MGSEPRHPSISSNALQPLENEKRICQMRRKHWHSEALKLSGMICYL